MINSAELVHKDHYISVIFKQGRLVDVTIQEQDGTVLFTGNPVQARNLSEALEYVLNYDFTFNEPGTTGLEDDRQEVE